MCNFHRIQVFFLLEVEIFMCTSLCEIPRTPGFPFYCAPPPRFSHVPLPLIHTVNIVQSVHSKQWPRNVRHEFKAAKEKEAF